MGTWRGFQPDGRPDTHNHNRTTTKTAMEAPMKLLDYHETVQIPKGRYQVGELCFYFYKTIQFEKQNKPYVFFSSQENYLWGSKQYPCTNSSQTLVLDELAFLPWQPIT